MATYIPNVTDTFPEIQTFRPDYSFLQSALQYKQSKFDAAFNQLNSVYGSILNAPLTRGINQERRDEFIKAADSELKKITSLDLSLPQNVQLASNVFKPFYEDQNLVKDITWTKNWNNEVQRAESLKNSDKEETQLQYWEGGVELLGYERERFANSDDSEAAKIGMSRYTPNFNVVKEAVNLAKEQGFNVKYDQIQGGYIVTTKNGKALEAPLSIYFSEVFANDPRAQSYSNAQARLQRERGIREMAPQYNNDLKLAESAYINNTLKSVLSIKESQNAELEKDFLKANATKTTYEQIMKTRDLLPSEQKKYNETLVSYNTLNSAIDRNAASISMMKNGFSPDNLSAGRNLVDRMAASVLLQSDLRNAVKAAAYRDTETSYKADPYSLASFQARLKEEADIRKEKREAEREAVKAGFFDTLLKKPVTDKNFKIEDLFGDQSASVAASRSELGQDVSSLVSSLRSGSDEIKSAVDDLIRKNGLTEENISGKIMADPAKYRKLFKDINETILTTDKNLAIQLNPLVKEAMKDVEKYDYQSTIFKDNNKLIARELKSNEYKNNPELVDLIIDPNTGDLRSLDSFVEAAKKKGINTRSSSGIGGVLGGIFNAFTKTSPSLFDLPGKGETFESATRQAEYNNAEKLYDDLTEQLKTKYDRQRDNLKSLGLGITGGAGGRGVAQTGIAVVDPSRYQSPTLQAARSLLNELESFDNITTIDGVNGNAILENLRIDLNTPYNEKNPAQDRPIVSIEYVPFKDGTSTKHEAIIRLNSDYLNRLKTQGLIDKNKDINEIEKLAQDGIRITVDANKSNNDFKKSLETDYRDVILKNTGKYTIENPGGKLTMITQPNGSVSMGGYVNQFKNGDIVQTPYNQYYLQSVGGSAFYDQTYDLLLQQALVNQTLMQKNNR
jgi:hypothetical protein